LAAQLGVTVFFHLSLDEIHHFVFREHIKESITGQQEELVVFVNNGSLQMMKRREEREMRE